LARFAHVVTTFAALLFAAQDINVKLLDDGKGGLGWSVLVAPVGTLVAALAGGWGGVLIGGRMNRSTLTRLEDERAEREDRREDRRARRDDAVDQARADRERGLEADRERRSIHAEQRRAVGAMRVAANGFDAARNTLSITLRSRRVFAEVLAITPAPPPADLQLMATWMSPAAWSVYENLATGLRALNQLGSGNLQDEFAPALEGLYDQLTGGITALRNEITRLLGEIGDPSHSYVWPTIPDHRA
jgi:hypothetical protein